MYRLLEVGEEVKEDDEFYRPSPGEWIAFTGSDLRLLRQPKITEGCLPVRRKIETTCECCHSAPAVMNVCHECYMAT